MLYHNGIWSYLQFGFLKLFQKQKVMEFLCYVGGYWTMRLSKFLNRAMSCQTRISVQDGLLKLSDRLWYLFSHISVFKTIVRMPPNARYTEINWVGSTFGDLNTRHQTLATIWKKIALMQGQCTSAKSYHWKNYPFEFWSGKRYMFDP